MLQIFKKIIEDNLLNVISLKNYSTKEDIIQISFTRDGSRHNLDLINPIFDLTNTTNIEITPQAELIFIREINKLKHESIFEFFEYAKKNRAFNSGFRWVLKSPELVFTYVAYEKTIRSILPGQLKNHLKCIPEESLLFYIRDLLEHDNWKNRKEKIYDILRDIHYYSILNKVCDIDSYKKDICNEVSNTAVNIYSVNYNLIKQTYGIKENFTKMDQQLNSFLKKFMVTLNKADKKIIESIAFSSSKIDMSESRKFYIEHNHNELYAKIFFGTVLEYFIDCMVNKVEDALKTKQIEDTLSTVNKKVFNEKMSDSLAQKVVQNRHKNKI